MSNQTYRFRHDKGLSTEHTIASLRKQVARGNLSARVKCTADHGQTWTSVGDLLEVAENLEIPADSAASGASGTRGNSETLRQSAEETSDGTTAAPSRRLRRLSLGEGNSKYSRIRAERERRKAAGLISTPEELVGEILANGRYEVVFVLFHHKNALHTTSVHPIDS